MCCSSIGPGWVWGEGSDRAFCYQGFQEVVGLESIVWKAVIALYLESNLQCLDIYVWKPSTPSLAFSVDFWSFLHAWPPCSIITSLMFSGCWLAPTHGQFISRYTFATSSANVAGMWCTVTEAGVLASYVDIFINCLTSHARCCACTWMSPCTLICKLWWHVLCWNLLSMQANLSIVCLANVTGAIRLSALEWYNGASSCMDASCPCLAVCFENGRVQVMKHELDTGACVCVYAHTCTCVCMTYMSVL